MTRLTWGAGRAAAIAMSSIPLADALPLVAAEIYMAHKIGDVYGVSFSDSTINGLFAAMGACLASVAKLWQDWLRGNAR